MNPEEIAIEAINDIITDLKKVQVDNQFYPWRKAAIGTLKRVVPFNETIFESLASISITTSLGGDYTQRGKQDSLVLLENLIRDIKRFGLEKPKMDEKNAEKITVLVSQQNQQNQTTSVSIQIDLIIEILKGELRTSEIEEVKEILESKVEPKEKKNKFIEKIKSFGNDIASNILASILTNPKVYEQLGGLL